MTESNMPEKTDAASSLVKTLEKSYSAALPSHVTMEHFSRALLTEFRRTPDLLKCTKDSIASGVMLFGQLGLMIGVNGAGWLIPFNNSKRKCKEAVVMIGYQGLVDLCYRSDRVESVCADVICENDIFEFEQGLTQKLKHIPNLHGSRGEPYAAYAIASIKCSERPVYVVLNKEEIMTIKEASPAARKLDSPWNGKFETEMWKKSAIRRLCKYLPKSVELASALEFESRQAEEIKDAECTVIEDDPFKPGRHESRKPKQTEVQPDAKSSSDNLNKQFLDAIGYIENHYAERQEFIDKGMNHYGMNTWDSEDKAMLPADKQHSIIELAKWLEKEI